MRSNQTARKFIQALQVRSPPSSLPGWNQNTTAIIKYLRSNTTCVSSKENGKAKIRNEQAYQDHSPQPVRSSILYDMADGQRGEEEDDRLEGVEEHSDRTFDDPSKGDDERDNEQHDLLEM